VARFANQIDAIHNDFTELETAIRIIERNI
jgi:hypothetical protein